MEHSRSKRHPQLRELSENLIQQEVVQSKNTIEDKTSVVVDSFAYPYAFPQWDTAFRTMLRELFQRPGTPAESVRSSVARELTVIRFFCHDFR